ncbi:hypothetical protein G9A89_020755 [Geosiphon pyriformis]|nr:hypothetical protein G9A89_020755 [Geosiphon pyriformis]
MPVSSTRSTFIPDKNNGMEGFPEQNQQVEKEHGEQITRQDLYDPEQDKQEKRWLRKEYRNLIAVTEENRQQYLRPDSDGLANTIARANDLYQRVRNTHEATLDSRLLVLSSDLGVQKARMMKLDHNSFDIDEYIAKVINYNRPRKVGGDEGQVVVNWSAIGKVAAKFTKRVPTMDFMLGPLSVPQKERTKSKPQIRIEKLQKDLRTPVRMKEVDIERQENETTRNVKMIADILQEVQPINLFEFIVNPNSFGQTVENMFYLSFLIRDGQVSIDDEDGQPILTRTEPATAEDYQDGLIKKQLVLEMDMELWHKLIDVYEIQNTVIPTREKREQMAGKCSKKSKIINSLPVSGLCQKCKGIVDWRKKFKKYKPLTIPKRCLSCEEKVIKEAYHVLCNSCAKAKGVCAKCQEDGEILSSSKKTEREILTEQQEQDRLLSTLSERQRRTYIRNLERGHEGPLESLVKGSENHSEDFEDKVDEHDPEDITSSGSDTYILGD